MPSSKSSEKSRKRAGGSNSAAPSAPRVVIVVGPSQECAETVAQGFAAEGEPMKVMWFQQARQVLAAGLQKALAGVVVCHRTEQTPDGDLRALRQALPDTPVLAWELQATA